MVNIGEASEIVNASKLQLRIAGDVYITMENLTLKIGRIETRDPTTDAGALYSYGKGDNFFTCTLVLTTPELGDAVGSFNALTKIDTDGDMLSTAWIIFATNISGATKSMAVTGILKEYTVSKPSEGKVHIDIFVRITGDTITIT